MGSSGDSGGGGYPGMFGAANPMPGLPVAGANSTIGDPYQYGKFQNFLPDVQASGQNAMATGLRPNMFNYQKPNPSGGPSTTLGPDTGNVSEVQKLRNDLAALTMKFSGAPNGGLGNIISSGNPIEGAG